jgi:lysophospholipase L1-like esterase
MTQLERPENCADYKQPRRFIPELIRMARAGESQCSLIAAICAGDPQLGYIDVATPMLAAGQPPPRDLYRFDGLHPSAKAYALRILIIKPRLQKDLEGSAH